MHKATRDCPNLPWCLDEFTYNEETFGEQVAKKPHFVMFYTPWCGHSKRLKPTWQDLSSKYNNKEDPDVLIAKVDCTTERSLCSAQDVSGYPTLKFFKSGTNSDSGVYWWGKKDLSSLIKFINEQMGFDSKAL